MTRHLLLLAIATALAATEMPAQGRGRRGRPDQAAPPAAAPEATAPAAKPETKPKKYLAIHGGDVDLGTGQRLTGATVLIADDKIEAVGHNLTLPEGTTKLDATGKTVCPGFIAVQGFGMGQGRGAPFADSTNPFDPEIKQALAAGITAFLAGSVPSGPTPQGGNAVIKMSYGDLQGMVPVEDSVVGMSAQLSLQDRERFTELVKKAKEYLAALEKFPQLKATDPNAKEPAQPPGAEKVLAVLKGEAKLWLSLGGAGFNPFGGGRRGGDSANDVDAIQQGLELATLLGKGVVLRKPTSAWLIPGEIAATGSMVVLSPRERVPSNPADPDRTGSNLAAAAILEQAGVACAVTCPSGMFGGAGVGTGGIMGQDLNTPHIDAAFAVRGGLDNRKALRTLTLDAAKALGVDRRMGSLEPGKDADILILGGDPLHYATFVATAVVNGKVVYEQAKEPLYRHLAR